METITILNDNSLEYQVLKRDLENNYLLNIIKVEPYTKLEDWINLALKEADDPLKVYIHFVYEDFSLKDLRTEIMELERKHKRLRIIAPYEQNDRITIKHRAENYGIVVEPVRPNRLQEQLKDIQETTVESPKVVESTIDLKKFAENIVTEDKLPKEEPKKKPKLRGLRLL